MDKIIIYTNNTCGYCKQIKEEFTKANLEFENKITSENESEWQEVINLTGMGTVPTVIYDDEYFVPGRDFQNAQQLADRLKSFETPKYTQSRRTFERVKTLNYNINMAFGRLDQLLRQIETKINTDEHKSTN
tara:strand:+ start:41 stop:436 length:396 start_codon:yes stop_codon:yes gene_type:complete